LRQTRKFADIQFFYSGFFQACSLSTSSHQNTQQDTQLLVATASQMLRSTSRNLFALFSLLPLAVAFTPVYSAITQCGPLTVTWGGSNVTTGPPFVLLVLPFDATPAIVKIPDSSFDPTTKIGKYTLDKLPLKGGAQVLLTMDDGYGALFSHPILSRARSHCLSCPFVS